MKAFLLAVTILLVAFSAHGEQATIVVKGSDTMVILGQRWAEQYMKTHPGTQIQVTGGGSGTGISALINGTTDICQSSRSIKPSEVKKLRERHASAGVEIPVAMDGVSIYVNDANAVQQISFSQLKAVYMGRITNWKEVGGADAPIIPYSRENSSGTYVFFKDVVLEGGDFAPRAQALPGTAAVVNAVLHERNGIGYGGAAYAKGIRVLRVQKDAAASAVAPNAETIANGSYPLARPLFFYLVTAPRGATKDYVDWVLSPAGQSIAIEVGFFALRGSTPGPHAEASPVLRADEGS